jgi:hypothetical protein
VSPLSEEEAKRYVDVDGDFLAAVKQMLAD